MTYLIQWYSVELNSNLKATNLIYFLRYITILLGIYISHDKLLINYLRKNKVPYKKKKCFLKKLMKYFVKYVLCTLYIEIKITCFIIWF